MDAHGRNAPLKGLDGLRGLAALAVFGVHYGQVVRPDALVGPFDLGRLLANGEHGVSLFFTLSGFLLGLPFWRHLLGQGPRPALSSYAWRRAARILPAYYLCLTLLILLGGYWRVPGSGADIALHYGLVFNYAEFSIFSLNPPFWSLAVELQFYLLLPAVFLLGRHLARHPWLTLAALAVSSYVLELGLLAALDQQVPWPGQPWFTWLQPYGAVLTYSLPAHLPHFLIGLALGYAWLSDSGRDMLTPVRADGVFWAALLLCGLLLAGPWATAVSLPHGRYSLPLVPLLLALLIYTAPVAPLAQRLLESAPIRALGLLSYGLYIYHYPVLQLTDHWMRLLGWDAAEHWLAFAMVSLALSLVAATLSRLLVERPALRWAHRRRARQGLALAR